MALQNKIAGTAEAMGNALVIPIDAFDEAALNELFVLRGNFGTVLD